MTVATCRVSNFGRNMSFTPTELLTPLTEEELLRILDQHRLGRIRIMGSRHSWSPLIETSGILLDLKHFSHIRFQESDGRLFVTVGAGVQIRTLIDALNQRGLTMPSLGLICEQTIAGATATGTHGSGRHSLSHYLTSVRIACYSPEGDKAILRTLSDGDELRAARCSLGCLGIVTEVTFPCVPQYFIQEQLVRADSIATALGMETETPLQQFFLIPHSWTVYVQRRKAVVQTSRSGLAALYRIYWLLVFDIGLHLLVLLAAALTKSRSLIRLMFRHIVPLSIISRWAPVDRSDRQLLMRHDLFRHLEEELFVRRSHLESACRLVQDLLQLADTPEHTVSDTTRSDLQKCGLWEEARSLAGRWCHHYPICIRRILPDETLISMASGEGEDWYSISFITYVEPRTDFQAVADLLARALERLYGGRPHWGKWNLLTADMAERLYPGLPRFRSVSQKCDPNRVFQNRYTDSILR